MIYLLAPNYHAALRYAATLPAGTLWRYVASEWTLEGTTGARVVRVAGFVSDPEVEASLVAASAVVTP